LLRKFLVRDPTKRPDLEILLDDQWLNEGFTATAVVRDVTEQLVGEDQQIMQIMDTKFGVEKDIIATGLKNNIYDDVMAIYFLLWNEKKRNGEASLLKVTEQMSIKTINGSDKALDSKATAEKMRLAADIHVILEEDHDHAAAAVDGTRKGKKDVSPPTTLPRAVAARKTDEVPRRGRRNTIAGDVDVKGMGEGDPEAKDLVAKLKALQTVKTTDSPSASKSATPEAARLPRQRSNTTADDEGKQARRMSIAGPPPVVVDTKVKKEVKKDRTSITSFLKLRRGSAAPDSSKADAGSNGSMDSTTSAVTVGDQKPRALRFTFNSNTTSSKAPEDVVQEILNACQSLGFRTRLTAKFAVECSADSPNTVPGADEPVKIQVEVCQLPRLKNLHGLRFKRVDGSSSDYKVICEKLLAAIKL
jgi:MAP/microtubule affinity-regulating kinase